MVPRPTWPSRPTRLVLDVTAGGGSIPFEAGRLGIQSIANELNPVATLILRATCEWPQKYGNALRDAYAEVSASTYFLARVREIWSPRTKLYPCREPGRRTKTTRCIKNPPEGAVRLHKYAQTYLWSRTVGCPGLR